MGHYVRLLSPSELVPALGRVRKLAALASATLELECGPPDDWFQATLAHRDGTAISLIERNVVRRGELGAREIEEFINELKHYRPCVQPTIRVSAQFVFCVGCLIHPCGGRRH